MIHYIQWTLQKEGDNSYITNAHYGIQVHYTWSKDKGEYYLYPYIDENNKTIYYYAFDSDQQKQRFVWFLKLSGIGIKTAFNIAGLDESQLKEIVNTLDIKALQALPGVWPKTARRILIELQQDFSKDALRKIQNTNTPQSKQVKKYLVWLGYNAELVQATIEKYPTKITAKNSKEVLAEIIKSL